jgi:predicted  nucleic acid-binding Zn-ribbon protein
LTEKSEQATTELQEEVEAAQEEKDTIVKQLKQSETSINNFENEVARLAEELSVRLENNSSLEKQLEETTLKVSNLSEMGISLCTWSLWGWFFSAS